MARKARRRKQTVLTQSQLVGTKQREAAAAGKVVVKAHKPAAMRRETVNFREEYQYVIADLNRIGLLAAFMFAVLIALNLLLK
jgi:hypothetical protein